MIEFLLLLLAVLLLLYYYKSSLNPISRNTNQLTPTSPPNKELSTEERREIILSRFKIEDKEETKQDIIKTEEPKPVTVKARIQTKLDWENDMLCDTFCLSHKVRYNLRILGR